MSPILLLISAPSGTGKTTLMQLILSAHPKLHRLVSVTTRPMRAEEIEGIDYHFVSLKQYNAMKDRSEFLETTKIYNNSYGTSKLMLDNIIDKGHDVIASLDYCGFLAINQTVKNCTIVTVFLMPPSIQELRERLLKRSQGGNDNEVELRMQNAEREISYATQYDHVIVNDNLETAFKQLSDIYQRQSDLRNNNLVTVVS